MRRAGRAALAAAVPAGVMATQLIAAAAARVAGLGGGGDGGFALFFVMCAYCMAAGLWMTVLNRKAYGGSWEAPAPCRLAPGGRAMLLAAAYCLEWAAQCAASLARLHAPDLARGSGSGIPPDTETIYAAGLMLLSVTAVPMVEELGFRYFPLRILGERAGLGAALATSAAFALAHGSLVQGVPAFALGMLCALVMERTGDAVQCVAVHAAFNASGMLAPSWLLEGTGGLAAACAISLAGAAALGAAALAGARPREGAADA